MKQEKATGLLQASQENNQKLKNVQEAIAAFKAINKEKPKPRQAMEAKNVEIA